MIRREKVDYYILHETMVDEDITRKHHEILHENVSNVGGNKIFTLTYKQVLQSLTRNWNGRSYGKTILTDGYTKNPLVQYDLGHGGLFGEYGHPLIEKGQNELARQMTIFPPNVCWKVLNPHWEGDLLMGEVTTVAGGYGDMLRDRVLSGDPSMASSRAIGGCDRNGNVLPGYTLVCWDSVYRPSHKEAYHVDNSVRVNSFDLPANNTMSESAVILNPTGDAVKNFLLSESVSRDSISRVCDTLNLDYDSMVITESAVKICRVDGDTKTTVVMPLNRVVDTEYYNLFK